MQLQLFEIQDSGTQLHLAKSGINTPKAPFPGSGEKMRILVLAKVKNSDNKIGIFDLTPLRRDFTQYSDDAVGEKIMVQLRL